MFTVAEGLENMGAIKTGGQGSVYKGRRRGEIISAVKLLPTPIFSQSDEDPHYRGFINEVKKLQRVSESPNPNVVRLLSYGINEASGFPFIEMEYIDGPDLAALLKAPYDPVFTLKEIVKLAEHLSKALSHCHQLGIKHGDIKSNNIRYNRQTGNFVLLDFGLAVLSHEERRASKQQAGAIEFMAPEQNEGTLLFETDVYSYGVVLFEVLTGRVPFPLQANSVTARNKVMLAHLETPFPNILALRALALPSHWSAEKKAAEMQVPGWLVAVVCKCLQKNPDYRFANGVELHDYILDRRLYAAAAPPLAKEESNARKAGLEKDQELEALRTAVARQEKELKKLRRKPPVGTGKHRLPKAVAQPWLWAALLALFVVGGRVVFPLFFRPATAGNVTKDNSTPPDTLWGGARTVTVASENRSAAKSPVVVTHKNKAPEAPVNGAEKAIDAAGKKNVGATLDKTPKKQPTSPLTDAAANTVARAENDSFDFFARYKVRGEAHFYTEPEASKKRPAFITHWNNAVLKHLDEQDGYVYVIFTNFRGETSRGWLLKADLIKVK